jgi:hypothetical protein
VAVDSYFGSVSLLLDFDGADASTTFTDRSVSPKTLTPSGDAKLSTSVKKFGTASAVFDGSGDYITSSDSADYALPGDFTIEFQVWPDPGTGAWTRVLENEEFNLSGRTSGSRAPETSFGCSWRARCRPRR